MSEKQPIKWIVLNAAYTFIILGLSLAAAMVAKLILNLFLPIDLSSAQGGDYSRNYYLVFPIHGVVTAAVFLLTAYFGGKTNGFKTGFRFRTSISTPAFIVQAILAVIVYYFLFLYMFEWWTNLPTWYLSGFLAALFGIFDASNIYDSVAQGYAEIENIYFLYLWLHTLLEIAFIVVALILVKLGRTKGEREAAARHEAQMAELEKEKERIASKKTL